MDEMKNANAETRSRPVAMRAPLDDVKRSRAKAFALLEKMPARKKTDTWTTKQLIEFGRK